MKFDNLPALSEHQSLRWKPLQLFVCRCALDTDCTVLDLWATEKVFSITCDIIVINTATFSPKNHFIQYKSAAFCLYFHYMSTNKASLYLKKEIIIRAVCILQVVFSRHCSPCDIKELLCSSSNIPRSVVLFPHLLICLCYHIKSYYIKLHKNIIQYSKYVEKFHRVKPGKDIAY